MTRVTIYTSDGSKYDGRTTEKDERIQRFFFDGVRLALETGRRTTVYGFFRARESESGRSEQFYAEYETDSTSRLLHSFKRDLERRAEQDLGLTLVTGMDDLRIYEALPDTATEVPGDEFDQEAIDALLRNGHRLSFGVSDPESALATLTHFVLNGNATSGAIVDDAENVSLDTFDLLVEPGAYRGLQPLGETGQTLDAGRDQVEEEYIQKALANMEKDLRTLQERTSISSAELGQRLRQQLPMLSTPTEPDAGSDDRRDVYKRGLAVVAVFVGVLLLGVVAVYLATMFGISIPVVSGLSWLDGGGEPAGVSPSPTIEAPRNNSTLDSSPITVRGNASVDNVTVRLEGPNRTIPKDVRVSNETFTVNFSVNSSGRYTVQVTPADNRSGSATATFTVQLPPTATTTPSPTQTNVSTNATSASVALDTVGVRGSLYQSPDSEIAEHRAEPDREYQDDLRRPEKFDTAK